jgi:hypothetical protein
VNIYEKKHIQRGNGERGKGVGEQQPQQQQHQQTTNNIQRRVIGRAHGGGAECEMVQNGEKRVQRQNYDKVLNLRESAEFRRKVLNLKESAGFREGEHLE